MEYDMATFGSSMRRWKSGEGNLAEEEEVDLLESPSREFTRGSNCEQENQKTYGGGHKKSEREFGRNIEELREIKSVIGHIREDHQQLSTRGEGGIWEVGYKWWWRGNTAFGEGRFARRIRMRGGG